MKAAVLNGFAIFIAVFPAAINIGVCFAEEEGEIKDTQYSETIITPQNREPAIEIPIGMELQKIGNINMVVPKGTQMRKKGSRLIMEDTDEYVGRNIYEIRERLDLVEGRQRDLEKGLDELKENMSKQKVID